MGSCSSIPAAVVPALVATMPTIRPSLRRKWKRRGIFHQMMERHIRIIQRKRGLPLQPDPPPLRHNVSFELEVKPSTP